MDDTRLDPFFINIPLAATPQTSQNWEQASQAPTMLYPVPAMAEVKACHVHRICSGRTLLVLVPREAVFVL